MIFSNPLQRAKLCVMHWIGLAPLSREIQSWPSLLQLARANSALAPDWGLKINILGLFLFFLYCLFLFYPEDAVLVLAEFAVAFCSGFRNFLKTLRIFKRKLGCFVLLIQFPSSCQCCVRNSGTADRISWPSDLDQGWGPGFPVIWSFLNLVRVS